MYYFCFTDLLLVTTNVVAAPNINTDTSTTIISPVFGDVASCAAAPFVVPSSALFDITSFAGIFISILSSNSSSYSVVNVAVITTFPSFSAVTFPFSSTVAIASSEELYFIV